MAVVQSHLDGKTPSIKHDFRMLCKDGRYKWILGRGTLVSRDADGKPLRLVGTTADLSERKRTEAQLIEITEILREQVNLRITRLRETSMKLTMTEERERRSLAQELHDNIGQLLAIIKIKLTPLVLRKVAPSLDEIMGLVEKVDQSVRMVTRQLSLPILNTLGFGPAVAWLADEMQSMYGLSVLFDDATGAVAMVDGVEAVLYRSVRELLINVAKHAKASHARVSFHRDDDRVVLVVSDDGCGFDSANFHETLAGTHSFGLSSIYERVINIGGVMDIVSSHGLGTTVTLVMPCAIAVKEYQLS